MLRSKKKEAVKVNNGMIESVSLFDKFGITYMEFGSNEMKCKFYSDEVKRDKVFDDAVKFSFLHDDKVQLKRISKFDLQEQTFDSVFKQKAFFSDDTKTVEKEFESHEAYRAWQKEDIRTRYKFYGMGMRDGKLVVNIAEGLV